MLAGEIRKREDALSCDWTDAGPKKPPFHAHLTAALALALPAGFCGNGLVTGLTFVPVATAPFSSSNIGTLDLLW